MNHLRKSLSILIALLLLLTLLPMSALAADIEMEAGTPATNPITVNTSTIGFAGQEWYVIGYNGSAISPTYNTPANNVTLLVKDPDLTDGVTPYGNTAFHATSSDYSGSTLQSKMSDIATSIQTASLKEYNLITERTIGTDGIGGSSVSVGQPLWPLSKAEWTTIGNNTVRSYGNRWWLRSPDGTNIASFSFSGGSVEGGDYVYYGDFAVRPALNLNLSSVLFTSAASGGKSKPTAVGASLSSAEPTTGAIKFTFSDGSAAPSVTFGSTTDGTSTLRFGYSGATTGGNQYLSCVLTNASGVQYYGKLANCAAVGSGVFTIDTSSLASDTYTLKIFSEQAGGNNYSDFASATTDFTLVVSGGDGTVTGGTPDSARPTVSTVTPDGASEPISGNIEITFNEAMNPATGIGTVSLTGGASTVTAPGVWSAGNTVYTIGYSGLSNSTAYNYSISGFQDAAGNEMIANPSGYAFTTDTAPYVPPYVPPSSGGTTVTPVPPVAEVPALAFPVDGAEALRRLNVYGSESLRGSRLFRIAKGDEFTILGVSDNGKAFLIEYDGEQGYVAMKDIVATFGNSVKGTASRKASAYVQQDNGKLKRAGYFNKGKELNITGIDGAYLINKQKNQTYYLKASEWLLG